MQRLPRHARSGWILLMLASATTLTGCERTGGPAEPQGTLASTSPPATSPSSLPIGGDGAKQPPMPSGAPTSGPAPAALPSATAAPTGSIVPERPWKRPWAGTWSSGPCGARKYERVLTLRDSFTFDAEDRVSPCPPGAACVWSGIVMRKGSYRVEGATAILTVQDGAPTKPAAALPSTLAWDDGKAAPVEQTDGSSCPYVRVR